MNMAQKLIRNEVLTQLIQFASIHIQQIGHTGWIRMLLLTQAFGNKQTVLCLIGRDYGCLPSGVESTSGDV